MSQKMISSFRGEHAFLSNMYASPIICEGETYLTVENAFQAAKTLDLSERKELFSSSSPYSAKQQGRKVQLRRDWEQVKLPIMKQLIFRKFHSNPSLIEKLLTTKDATLIEGNTWGDTFWGMDTRKGGENHLGIILMDVRDMLESCRS